MSQWHGSRLFIEPVSEPFTNRTEYAIVGAVVRLADLGASLFAPTLFVALSFFHRHSSFVKARPGVFLLYWPMGVELRGGKLWASKWIGRLSNQHVLAIYPWRDADVVEPLVLRMDQLLERVCAELNCPSRVTLAFETRPGVSGGWWSSVYGGGETTFLYSE